MKYRLALLAAVPLCLVASTARAQGVGLKGGLVWNTVRNSGAFPGSLGTNTGWTGGLMVGSEKGLLGFGVEGLYARRGVSSPTVTDSRRLDYIDVPAYLRVMIPTPGIAPYAYAGPQISFELNCSAGGGTTCPSGRPKTTYAGVIGAGASLGRGRGSNLSVEGRYMYGLSDLKLSTATSSTSYKTRSFLILMGIGF